MLRSIQTCGAVLWLLSATTFVWAQETKPVPEAKPVPETKPVANPIEGSLQLGKQTFKLSHIVAYETKFNDETMINILMSDRAVPTNKIKSALAEEDGGSDQSLLLSQPHLKLVFKKSGKVAWFNAIAGGTTISTSSDDLAADLKLEDGRVKGQAKLPLEGEGALARSFDVKYDVALGLDQAPKKVRPAGPIKPTVAGTFKGNGQQAKLAFISARTGEPFSDDKPSIVLILTEQDHTKDPKAENNASFGKYGSALVVSMKQDGDVFGCQVAHAAHGGGAFSSSGTISISEFDLGDGQVSGKLTTNGEDEFFDKKWEVELTFVAPYVVPATPKPVLVAEEPAAKKAKKTKSKKKTSDKPAKEKTDSPADTDKPAEPAGEMLSIYDLALPKGATDQEYKAVVEHFAFSSEMDVKGLVEAFSKSLADQGWEADGSDLVAPKSAILKRKRGEAKLTIFVKPATKGSRATMFTEGLDWKEKAEKKTDKVEKEEKEEKKDE